jgi:hypothetical protein
MSVPNTTTFDLPAIVAELGGGLTSLQTCFTNANASGFDPAYNNDTYAPTNSMLRFRNYARYDPWGYFNGTGSQGTLVLGFFSTTDFRVECDFILTDKSVDRLLFGVSDVNGDDIFAVYYKTVYDNMGFTKGSLFYRRFSLDNNFKLNVPYHVDVRFRTSSINFTIYEIGSSSASSSWTQSYVPLGSPPQNWLSLGAYFSNSTDAWKGYIRNLSAYADTSQVGNINNTWTSVPPYSSFNVAEVGV